MSPMRFIASGCTVLAIVLIPIACKAQHATGEIRRVVLEIRRSAGYIEVAPQDVSRDGARIQQWEFTGGTCQEWLLVPVKNEPGFYHIENRASGKVLDVDSNRINENGANVQQWSKHSGHNQQFRFVPCGNGFVTIVNRASGKVLDADFNHIAEKGANIQQWESHGAPNQQFRFVTR